ncbi:hypothetical protein PWEIH_01500 [Listeria weihenstephanensis FSL R9-0317]|nr:hypothetical protein PWEIH_01500 [Listeria weihenstephanensis FSL R9-0317]
MKGVMLMYVGYQIWRKEMPDVSCRIDYDGTWVWNVYSILPQARYRNGASNEKRQIKNHLIIP